MAIAELKKRADATDTAIERLDERVTKHDEIIAALCESLATKDDIADLRSDLRERLDRDELLDERISMYRQQVDEMRAGHETRFNRRMSWAMVALFVGELILGWMGLHNGK